MSEVQAREDESRFSNTKKNPKPTKEAYFAEIPAQALLVEPMIISLAKDETETKVEHQSASSLASRDDMGLSIMTKTREMYQTLNHCSSLK